MSNIMGFPLLTLITFLPLLGGVILMFFFKKEHTKAIKFFATIVVLVDFFLSIPLWTEFDTSEAGFQFLEKASWIPAIGVNYLIAVDGISVLLVLLTTLTMLVSVVCSYSAIKEREKEYYVCMLFLATGMIGTFVSLESISFLRILRGHPCSDVFSDWNLGGNPEALRCNKVLSLHAVRQRAHVTGNPGSVFLQFKSGNGSIQPLISLNFMMLGQKYRWKFNVGFSWLSSSDLRSKCHCFPSTLGCLTPT